MTRKLLNLGCGDRYHPDWVNVDFHSSNPAVLAHDLKERLPFEDDFFDVVYHSHVQEHLPKFSVLMFYHECFRVLKPGGIIRLVMPDLEQVASIYLELLEQALQGDVVAQERYEWITIELLDQMVRNQSGGEMLRYWMQDPMPAEDFVIARVGSEAKNMINQLRNPTSDKGLGEGLLYYEEDYETIGKFRLSGEVHQWMYDRYSVRVLLNKAGFTEIKKCGADESAIEKFNEYLLDIEPDGSIRKPDSLYVEAVKPLNESALDRTARMNSINTLEAQLKDNKANRKRHHGIIQQLEAQLRESEEDRAARLKVIHQLHGQLQEIHAAHAVQADAFYKMKAQLKESQADLTAKYEENKRLNEEIYHLKSSVCWKIMSHLRWFKRYLSGKRQVF